jgi:hypothetical protein
LRDEQARTGLRFNSAGVGIEPGGVTVTGIPEAAGATLIRDVRRNRRFEYMVVFTKGAVVGQEWASSIKKDLAAKGRLGGARARWLDPVRGEVTGRQAPQAARGSWRGGARTGIRVRGCRRR